MPTIIHRLREEMAANPEDLNLVVQLATAYNQLDDHKNATRYFKRAVRLQPDSSQLHMLYGRALRLNGENLKAEKSLRRAIQLDPGNAEAFRNIGNLELHHLGRCEEGMKNLVHAATLAPDLPDIYAEIGFGLTSTRTVEDATKCFQELLPTLPDRLQGLMGFGSGLGMNGYVDDARKLFEEVVAEDPENIEAWNALGQTAVEKAEYQAATRYRQKALDLNEGHSMTLHHHLADLVRMGDYRQARTIYRKYTQAFSVFFPSATNAAPEWDGQTSLKGKTILLNSTLGFGDTLQFCRLAKFLKDQGATVLLRTQKTLSALLKRAPGIDAVTPEMETEVQADYESQLYLMLMKLDFELEQVGALVPYLRASPYQLQRYKSRISGDAYKIGLIWQGAYRIMHNPNTRRSLSLNELAPLAKLPGVELYSLQTGPAANQRDQWAGEIPIRELIPNSPSFDETAAAMQSMDLIVTVDTAGAHLAGGLGAKTYLLLPFAPCWRWGVRRSDCSWYPTFRLFRQSEPGNWAEPVNEIVSAIERDLRQSAR